jgi:hypothetical protein
LAEQQLLVHHPSLTQQNGLLLGESAALQNNNINTVFKWCLLVKNGDLSEEYFSVNTPLWVSSRYSHPAQSFFHRICREENQKRMLLPTFSLNLLRLPSAGKMGLSSEGTSTSSVFLLFL